MARSKKQDIFTRFTTKTSEMLGRPWVFISSLALLLVWGASGPFLGFSETWQLVINTATTVITFLMVFIIQNTQNRNDLAVHIKLDRLLEEHGVKGEDLVGAENASDKELEKQQIKEEKRAVRKNRANKTKKK